MKQKNILAIIVLCFIASCAAPTPTPSPIPTAPPTKTLAPSPSPAPLATATLQSTLALPTLTSTKTLAPSPLLTSSATATLQPTVALPTLTPTKSTPLSEKGPWLIYKTRAQSKHAIVAINVDGTGRTVLQELISTDTSPNFNFSVSSPFSTVAIFDGNDRRNPTISLVQLPDKRTKAINLLTYPNLEQATPNALFKEFRTTPFDQAQSAVSRNNDLLWSPDKRYLAFVAAIDGPTSDLYVYDSQNGSVRQLSDGLYQAGELIWSSDGKWIVQEALIYQVGCPVQEVWAISLDGISTKKLEGTTGCEGFLGWINPTTLLVYEAGASPRRGITAVDIITGKAIVLHGYFFGAVAFDSGSGTLVTTSPGNEKIKPGIYLSSLSNPAEKLVVEMSIGFFPSNGGYTPLSWNKEENYFVSEGGPCKADEELRITLSADVSCNAPISPKDQSDILFPSPDKKWVVNISDGTLLSDLDKSLKKKFFEQKTTDIAWRPDSKGFFFAFKTGLYYFAIDSQQALLIDSNLAEYSFIRLVEKK